MKFFIHFNKISQDGVGFKKNKNHGLWAIQLISGAWYWIPLFCYSPRLIRAPEMNDWETSCWLCWGTENKEGWAWETEIPRAALQDVLYYSKIKGSDRGPLRAAFCFHAAIMFTWGFLTVNAYGLKDRLPSLNISVPESPDRLWLPCSCPMYCLHICSPGDIDVNTGMDTVNTITM